MCACLRTLFPRGCTPIKVIEIVNAILEPFHDDHEDDEKAYADICTTTNLETALGFAPMLMHNMPVHLLSSFYHPVVLAIVSHDTNIDMRAARASNATIAVKHWLQPEKYADTIKAGGKRPSNIAHADMITAITKHLVLLDVSYGVPLIDQNFALPRGCAPSRMTNKLHREFRK